VSQLESVKLYYEPHLWNISKSKTQTLTSRCHNRSLPSLALHRMHFYWHRNIVLTQTDTRMSSIEVKIKKLDGELAKYKEQMSKLRNGPGKVRSTSPLFRLSSIIITFAASHPTTRSPNSETEKDVWISAFTADAANFQYGICGTDYGESTEHNGDCRCSSGFEQGDQKAVRKD